MPIRLGCPNRGSDTAVLGTHVAHEDWVLRRGTVISSLKPRLSCLVVRLSLATLMTLIIPALAVRADILITKGGGRWEGTVTEKGDDYQVVLPNGSKMTFSKSAVQEVLRPEPKKEAPPDTTGNTQDQPASATDLPDKDEPGQAAPPIESFESAIREIEQTQATITQDKNLTTAQRADAIAKAEDRLKKTLESHLWSTEAQVNDVIPGDGEWELDLTVAGKQVRCPVNITKDKALSLHRGDKLTVYLRIYFRDFNTWQVTGALLDVPIPANTLCKFFGVPINVGRKVVYVIDRSGSMSDSIDHVKNALKKCLKDLTDKSQFHIIFYSSGPPVEMPTRRLVDATDRNKQLAFEFIDGVALQGETDPSKALERAFACQPDAIYLLTDGEFDKSIVGLVKQLNVGGKVTVHTISFLYQMGEGVLKKIAEENGGQYKFVSGADLDKDPTNNVGLREKLVRLYLVDKNDPEEAAKHLEGVADVTLRKYVSAAAKPLEELPEPLCLELGDWYMTLSDSTPMPSSKAALLTRAAAYYQRFLELHTADDSTRAKATFALKELRQAENSLAKAKPGAPAGAQNVVAAAIHSYVSAVKATHDDRQSQLTDIQKRKVWLESTQQLDAVLRSNRFIVTYMVGEVVFDPRTRSARIKPESAAIETSDPNVEPVVMGLLFHVRIACSEGEAMKIRKDSTVTVEGTAALNVDFSADLARQPALLYPMEYATVPDSRGFDGFVGISLSECEVAEIERLLGNEFNRSIYSMKGCWPVGALPGVPSQIWLVMGSRSVTRIDGVVRRRVFSAFINR